MAYSKAKLKSSADNEGGENNDDKDDINDNNPHT
jgi:hypothetical protein